MTQIPTDQEINRALAELMGYSLHKTAGNYYVVEDKGGSPATYYYGTADIAWSKAPDYCNNPAASLEVQAAAIAKDAELYVTRLFEVVRGELSALYTDLEAADMLTATPRERAMAAWMTLKTDTASGSA
ncbi:hypothetical protein PSTEL_00540 [Paenibacillus stellifer]|uniref:Phage ABA sandwich domain-containing protein n=1 Tax=Paenibacillus stellifer TaxID=169760 RepID=A0A089LJX5_9BACL|nr:hypothetical protein [Paenibacillus stellifer]AIQ61841.1 hypothetical protein PSTEL_00540 [Paenibacillus stellifer]